MKRELSEMIAQQAANDVAAQYPSVHIECCFKPVKDNDDASLVEVTIRTQDGSRLKLYTYGTISHERYPNGAGLQAVLTSYCEQCARDFLT